MVLQAREHREDELFLAGRYSRFKRFPGGKGPLLLGYQEVSAFTHAFKRWTAKTPRQMRAQTDAGHE